MLENENISNDIERAKAFIENIVYFSVTPFALKDMIRYRQSSINIIDVRNHNDYIKGHIPYSINYLTNENEDLFNIAERSKANIICGDLKDCENIYRIADILLKNNYPCVILQGGFEMWEKYEFEIITGT